MKNQKYLKKRLLKKNIKLNNLDDIVYLEEGAISNKDEIAELKLSAKTNINTFEPKKNQYYDVLINLECINGVVDNDNIESVKCFR